MENIARSLPVIQWFLLISSMAGIRIAVRLLGERAALKRSQSRETSSGPKHVLVVGVTDLTELYLRSVDEFSQGNLTVIGIIASGPKMNGRFIRMHKVLGKPENVQTVLSELELHGVVVERICHAAVRMAIQGCARGPSSRGTFVDYRGRLVGREPWSTWRCFEGAGPSQAHV
jgi:FlaA1/EpsC-like NDP-sugar epimerase